MEKLDVDKGIIFYTDNRLELLDRDRMLPKLVMDSISASGLPIVNVSLKPLDFGKNIVLNLEPGVITYYKQILTALENSSSKYVFFCEHDVIYHPSHFYFTPPRDDTFYYNTNVWRCHPRNNICVTYDHLRSVSGLCVNRELALDHYKRRIEYIFQKGYDKVPKSRNPRWARVMGYEPGKSPRNGGFSVDKLAEWKSELPNLDIRHRLTMTIPKLRLDQFNHTPTGWQEKTIDEIEGWDIRNLFNL